MLNKPAPKQPAIFLHIHKTAGTTLHAVLERQYDKEAVYNMDSKGHGFDHLRGLSPSQRAKIDLLKGHMDFGLHEFLPQRANYFTFLREPIERVISYYYFIKRTPQHPHCQTARTLSLREFASRQIDPLMANGQTRQLAGGYPEYEFGDQAPRLLNKAKKHLEDRFVVVGITEKFDESLLLLQHYFKWRNIWYQRQNVAENRPKKREISPETVDLLKQLNQTDTAIYQFGRSLFEAQIAQQGALFPIRVRLFRRLNQLTKPVLRLRQFSIRARLGNLRPS